MDPTLKIVLEKITQLTNRFNKMTQNSKKIHELNNAVNDKNKFIAVSDGVDTEKVEYKPSEVSKDDFDNIANLKLSADVGTSTLTIKDSKGNVIASESLAFLNGNNVTLKIDNTLGVLQLLDYNSNVISSVSLTDLYPKNYEHQYTTTLADETSGTDVSFQLPHVVNTNIIPTVTINGHSLNSTQYSIVGNIFTLLSTTNYTIKANRLINIIYWY